MKDLEKKVRAKIEELENAREQIVRQANQQIAHINAEVQDLKVLIGEEVEQEPEAVEEEVEQPEPAEEEVEQEPEPVEDE